MDDPASGASPASRRARLVAREDAGERVRARAKRPLVEGARFATLDVGNPGEEVKIAQELPVAVVVELDGQKAPVEVALPLDHRVDRTRERRTPRPHDAASLIGVRSGAAAAAVPFFAAQHGHVARQTEHGTLGGHAGSIGGGKAELDGDILVPELLLDLERDDGGVARPQALQCLLVQLDLLLVEDALQRALPGIRVLLVEGDLLRTAHRGAHVVDDQVSEDPPHVGDEGARMPDLELVQPAHPPLNGLDHHVLRLDHASDRQRQTAGRETGQRLEAAQAERFEGDLVAGTRADRQLDGRLEVGLVPSAEQSRRGTGRGRSRADRPAVLAGGMAGQEDRGIPWRRGTRRLQFWRLGMGSGP